MSTLLGSSSIGMKAIQGSFPFYCACCLQDSSFLAGGGGGAARSGVANGTILFPVSPDSENHLETRILQEKNIVLQCAVSCDGELLALGLGKYTAIFDLTTHHIFSEFLRFKTDVSEHGFQSTLTWSPTERTILSTGGDDGVVRVWKISDDKIAPYETQLFEMVIAETPSYGDQRVTGLVFLPIGSPGLLISCASNILRIIDYRERNCILQTIVAPQPDKHRLHFRALAVDSEGLNLFAALSGIRCRGWISVFRQSKNHHWEIFRTVIVHHYPITALITSPTSHLAFGTSNGEVVVITSPSFSKQIVPLKHKLFVSALAFSRDGNQLFSVSGDSTAIITTVSQLRKFSVGKKLALFCVTMLLISCMIVGFQILV